MYRNFYKYNQRRIKIYEITIKNPCVDSKDMTII